MDKPRGELQNERQPDVSSRAQRATHYRGHSRQKQPARLCVLPLLADSAKSLREEAAGSVSTCRRSDLVTGGNNRPNVGMKF